MAQQRKRVARPRRSTHFVSRPFDDEDHQGYAKDYIKELLTNLRDLDQQMRRSLLIVVSLAAIYALARVNAASAVTVFSLRIENLSPLLAIIPVVTAYQFLNIMSAVADEGLILKSTHQVLRQSYPKLPMMTG